MPDIRIFVACHKECVTVENRYLYPIQVGCTVNQFHIDGMLHDDDGINISSKNLQYCELTAQYWAWKNCLDADYYGLFHYRRYMSFTDVELPHNAFQDVVLDSLNDETVKQLGLQEQTMEQMVTQYDAIATSAVDLRKLDSILKSNYHQYSISEHLKKSDLDLVLDIIEEKYPEYADTAKRYIHAKQGYFCNMFIMKREIFMAYSEWLFTILEEHEKRVDLSEYNIDEIRVSGHLAERLFGIYFTYLKEHGYQCKELQRTLLKNVYEKQDIRPYYKNNNIAVAFASNDYFAPYLACTIQSLVDNSSTDYGYDILIMTEDFSEENKAVYRNQFDSENVKVRFVDPVRYIETKHLYTRGHFSRETYYRLALFELLPDYEKVLYLDADIIIQADVAELFNEDIEGYLLAATVDADSAGLYNGTYERGKRAYVDKELNLRNPYGYFQAGVILFNLKEFRRIFQLQDVIQTAEEKDWQLLDQDVLNVLCQDKVKYISMSWNLLVDFDGVRRNQIIRKAPYSIQYTYDMARKKPRIIHYAGPEKPWNNPSMDMASVYWLYAKKIPYYEVVLQRMNQYVALNTSIRKRLIKRSKEYIEKNAKKTRMKLIEVETLVSSFVQSK